MVIPIRAAQNAERKDDCERTVGVLDAPGGTVSMGADSLLGNRVVVDGSGKNRSRGVSTAVETAALER